MKSRRLYFSDLYPGLLSLQPGHGKEYIEAVMLADAKAELKKNRLRVKELEADRRQRVHRTYLLLLAIRRYCKHCQGARPDLIAQCTNKGCPLWCYRAGPRGEGL
jgi:hypothetical protein